MAGLAVGLLALAGTPGAVHAKAKAQIREETKAPAGAQPAHRQTAQAAYVFVQGRGILSLRAGSAALVLPTKSDIRDLRLDGRGGLWASLRKGGVVRIAGGRTVSVCPESFDKLAIRTPSDVWAIDDAHGGVVHFDGKRWRSARTRNSLTGAFSDNHLLDIASDGHAVWVTGWNGLWQVAAGRWTRLPPPRQAMEKPGAERDRTPPYPLSLLASGQGLIACYLAGCFVTKGSGWRPSHWPTRRAVLRGAGNRDLLAGPGADGRTVVVARLGGKAEASETLPATGINDIAIDGSDRVWVAVGSRLWVLDARARTLARWQPATTDDSTGTIQRVVVEGPGPERLPAE